MSKMQKRKPKSKKIRGRKLLPAPAGGIVQFNGIELNPQELLMKAVDRGANIDILEKFLNLSDRVEQKQAEKVFRQAMADFQAECPIIIKGTGVMEKEDKKAIRYKYAKIDAIVKVVKPYLQKHGFSYRITSETIEKPFIGIKATVIANHVGGFSESSTFSTPYMDSKYMSTAQSWLTAQSFARRIAFCNEFGIMTGEDDLDGNNPGEEKKEKAGIKNLPGQENLSEKEKEKIRKEGLKKMNELPDYVKQGFGILKYTEKQIYLFCEKFQWDHKKIRFEIDRIVHAIEGSVKK